MAFKLLITAAAVVTGQSPPVASFRNFDGAFCTDDGLAFDGSDDFLAINPDFDIRSEPTPSRAPPWLHTCCRPANDPHLCCAHKPESMPAFGIQLSCMWCLGLFIIYMQK